MVTYKPNFKLTIDYMEYVLIELTLDDTGVPYQTWIENVSDNNRRTTYIYKEKCWWYFNSDLQKLTRSAYQNSINTIIYTYLNKLTNDKILE